MSRHHWRLRPADSWLLASRYDALSMPGTLACCRSTSVFLRGTGALIQAVVPIEACGWPSSTAPAPTAAACRSGSPVTATADGGMPSCAATSGSTGPTTDPVATSGGSSDPSTPAARTSTSS